MFSFHEILQTAQGQHLSGNLQRTVTGVSTDSRTINRDELFICLTGPNFDGHAFISQALEKGASGVLLESAQRVEALKSQFPEAVLIAVPNGLRALGDLAQYHRRKFTIPLVAITGSNGKTTTKDLVAAVLATSFKVLATQGNLNNLIGVPQMLLRLNDSIQACVLEMGMNDFGEIDRLTEIAEPTVGLITNVGEAHLEKLKSKEGIAKAKGELFARMPPRSLAIVNRDDPLVVKLDTRAYRISFGLENPADVSCIQSHFSPQGVSFQVRYLGKDYHFTAPLLGLPNLRNALAAVTVGFALAVNPSKIQKALKDFKAPSMRLEKIRLKHDITILNDCYNANPSSMEAALEVLKNTKNEAPGLAILGEMRELGERTAELHFKLGQSVAKNRIQHLIAIGPYATEVTAGAIKTGMNPAFVWALQNQNELSEKLTDWVKLAKVVLIKGSRAAQMEKITQQLKETLS